MTDDELDDAFREGRLTKRAFVRQRIDRGDDMTGALARAETIVPSSPPPGPTPDPEPPAGGEVPARPVMREGLDINFVGDGYVVYEPSGKRMHSLNHTAAVILELCTGDHDAQTIAELLQRTFDLDEPPRSETDACLRQLAREDLVG